MKSASQLFLGLLTAIGSSIMILTAAALALLEGGAGGFSVSPITATPTIPLVSTPTGQVSGVTPSPNANPEITTPTHVIIMVPSATEVSSCQSKPKDWQPYIVLDGDSIDTLAEKVSMSTETLLKANCMVSTSLQPGWIIYLPFLPPTPTQLATQAIAPTVCGAPRGWVLYTVQPGDNLYRLSLMFNISQNMLRVANCLPNEFIRAGQTLYVPFIPTRTPTKTGTPTATVTSPSATPQTPTVKKDQTIDFAALPNKVFGDPDFTVSAKASSGLPVSFSASGNCTVTVNQVNINSACICTITALQSGDNIYNPAPPVSQTFQIAKAGQTIVFVLPPTMIYTATPFTVNATASSLLPVSIKSSGTCTNNDNTIILTSVGTCTLTASQAGNSNYNPAPDVVLSFTITQASQDITFNPPQEVLLANGDFSISATASSGLTVTFTSNTTGICTVSGSTVHPLSIGPCTITASVEIQQGDQNYTKAAPVTKTIQVK